MRAPDLAPSDARPGPAPAAAPAGRRIPAHLVAATVAGNALEFFDFITYAFFAVYIGRAFFPTGSPFMSLLLSVAVFGVGFIARPLGGVLIGAFADRTGRRPAMLLTITLITVGTMGLALTPSYESIGPAAPLIVVASRLVQGLALGGEVGPCSAFLLEAAPPGRRGLYASWQSASQGAAALVAGLLGWGLTAALTPAQMQAWGWRVPFAAGLLLLPLALYLRRALPETLHGGGPRPAVVEPPSSSRLAGLGRHRRHLVLAVLVIIGGTVSTYVATFMTTYAITTLHLPPATSMTATVITGVGTLAFALVGGWLSDRVGRRPAMIWPRVATAVLAVPCFLWLVARPDVVTLVVVSGVLAALTGISAAASLVAIPELLPRGVRATGMSLAYAVGVSVFGGSTQFVVTWLIGATGSPLAPAWYVTATSIVSSLAMLALPESRDRELPV